MRAIYYYFERDFVKWLRGRVTVISSLVMPAAWLVFVGLPCPQNLLIIIFNLSLLASLL